VQRPGGLQQLGRVLAVGDEQVPGVCVAGGELPEGPVGRLLTGGVGVGGHDRVRFARADVRAELVGLGVGERGAERGDADEVTVTGEGDGDGVHRAFDEYHGGSLGQRGRRLGEAVQLVALAEQIGLGGVEVLRSGLGRVAVVTVMGWVAATDPAADLGVAISVGGFDGEDEAVAELVDDAAGGGDPAKAGADDLLVGRAVAA
jgi:hypothetical protein